MYFIKFGRSVVDCQITAVVKINGKIPFRHFHVFDQRIQPLVKIIFSPERRSDCKNKLVCRRFVKFIAVPSVRAINFSRKQIHISIVSCVTENFYLHIIHKIQQRIIPSCFLHIITEISQYMIVKGISGVKFVGNRPVFPTVYVPRKAVIRQFVPQKAAVKQNGNAVHTCVILVQLEYGIDKNVENIQIYVYVRGFKKTVVVRRIKIALPHFQHFDLLHAVEKHNFASVAFHDVKNVFKQSIIFLTHTSQLHYYQRVFHVVENA